MSLNVLSFLFIGASFALYIGIAIWTRAGSTREFYIAGGGVSPMANGMATAADWMSAASFLSLAGVIAFMGRDGSVFLMGWTGGYVMLALLLAPYLRKFGKFTVPDFIGDRYYSNLARGVALLCAILISFIYVAGQMRGVGIVFSRYLQVQIEWGVVIGMVIVFCYAVLGGMKGVTYTQVAQYCVMICAFLVPALFLSLMMSGHLLPQSGLGAQLDDGRTILQTLDGMLTELGFDPYTQGQRSTWDRFMLTLVLMCGTAGLPHIIVRFFTVPSVRDARESAGWALVFIALLYTSVPGVAAFGRINLVQTLNGPDQQGVVYEEMPDWFKTWEDAGLIAWHDHNGDGRVQYAAGESFVGGRPIFTAERGERGERLLTNPGSGQFDSTRQPFATEVYIDHDILVLANPEIANLPAWVVALVAAGAVAAALSTAAGLLLVISTSVSHDLMKKTLRPDMSDRQELRYARLSAILALLLAGYAGINPPGFVAEVVALAFGLAAATVFPPILMGIFCRRMNMAGAVSGMLVGLVTTLAYVFYFKIIGGTPEQWLLGVSPEAFGAVAMVLNIMTACLVMWLTPPPPEHVQRLIDNVRVPRGVRWPVKVQTGARKK
ncbi:sodium:solute symporter family protein [Nitrincola sp. MINF-07-Sa-05]|uniref:sodium:solute symporter family protein n=1 Tax=Nitrincola salilacus TaxID=3400273 RepID=UPI003917DB8C